MCTKEWILWWCRCRRGWFNRFILYWLSCLRIIMRVYWEGRVNRKLERCINKCGDKTCMKKSELYESFIYDLLKLINGKEYLRRSRCSCLLVYKQGICVFGCEWFIWRLLLFNWKWYGDYISVTGDILSFWWSEVQ